MSQEWFYSKDGKTKDGPFSSAQLQALAKSGQLLPTYMVLKFGTNKWVAAEKIPDLFRHSAPPPLAQTRPAGPYQDNDPRTPPSRVETTPVSNRRPDPSASLPPLAPISISEGRQLPDAHHDYARAYERRSAKRNRIGLFVGIGAGGLVLLVLVVLGTLWASGFFSRSPSGQQGAAGQRDFVDRIDPAAEEEKDAAGEKDFVDRIDDFLGISSDLKTAAIRDNFSSLKFVDLETRKQLAAPTWDQAWGAPKSVVFSNEVVAVLAEGGEKNGSSGFLVGKKRGKMPIQGPIQGGTSSCATSISLPSS